VILLGPFYTTLGWRGSRFELSNTAENIVIKGVKPRCLVQLTQVYDLAMRLPDTSSIEFLHKESPVIKAAPYSFVICVLLAALIVWGIVWLIFRERLSRDRHTIDHQEREIGRLQKELLRQHDAPDMSDPPYHRQAATATAADHSTHIDFKPNINAFQSASTSSVPPEKWPPLLCSTDSYIEATFVGDFTPADLQEARMSVSAYTRVTDLVFEAARGALSDGEVKVAGGYADVLKSLRRSSIKLEIVNA